MHVHAHGHNRGESGRALKWSLIATLAFVAVQTAAGLTSGSLALLSDAGHNFTDALALGLALFGLYLQGKPADDTRTWGYHRGGVLAAFVNALLLIGLALFLFVESWHRLMAPRDVSEQAMIQVAAFGIVLNVAIMVALHKGSHDLNIRAAWAHMLGDALGSVAIIIGAVVMGRTGWHAIDPLLSILIAGLIIWTAWSIVRESLNVLLEGMPGGMTLDGVKAAMRSVRGVLDVHDVHVWSLGTSAHALSCHALIEDMPPSESTVILDRLNCVLAEQFHIHHTTIQFEHRVCALAHEPCNFETPQKTTA